MVRSGGVTNVEKTSLEAHVELCSMRYQHLDERLSTLEEKVDVIHKDIIDGQKSLSKVIITTAGSIIVAVITGLLALFLEIR